MNTSILCRRLASVCGVLTLLAGHFISAARHEEFYLICAVAYWIRLMAVVPLSTSYGNVLPGAAMLGIALMILCIVLMGLLLLSSLSLSFYLLFAAGAQHRLLRTAGVVYYIIAFVVFLGLVLVVANRSLTNFTGVDKIVLSPAYFIFPIVFVGLGFFYRWVAACDGRTKA
jgi:hypothetical protein